MGPARSPFTHGLTPGLGSSEAPYSDKDTEWDLLPGMPSFLGLCPPGAALTNPSGESGLVPSQLPDPPLILRGPCSAEGATPSSAGSSTSGVPPKQSGLEQPGRLASLIPSTPQRLQVGGCWALSLHTLPFLHPPSFLLPTLLLLPPRDVSPLSPACSDPHPALLPFLYPLSALPGGAPPPRTPAAPPGDQVQHWVSSASLAPQVVGSSNSCETLIFTGLQSRRGTPAYFRFLVLLLFPLFYSR